MTLPPRAVIAAPGWAAAVAGALLCSPDLAAAQVAIETEPAVVTRGQLARIRVVPTVPDLVTRVDGSIAGEPLHLWTPNAVTWSGLAAVPIDAAESVPVTLVLHRSGGADTVETHITTVEPVVAMERLSVAPKMAQPDSAAQARIAREIARARAVSRASHGTPRLWREPLLLPRESRITSTFGTGREFNGKVLSRHLGTDLAGAVGDAVTAPTDGRVALVADFYLAGKVVYLDHGEGLVTAYFHLSQARVSEGQLVRAGEPIGEVGQSGRVTGPHLHWVMRYGNVSVDPMSAVALLGESVATAADSP
ncbi:MAG: M23 family metallopeptidase [Gemmatimonadota bacterium]|nr:M23 family metallopeptidase [Gemmatimonadota bacterium]